MPKFKKEGAVLRPTTPSPVDMSENSDILMSSRRKALTNSKTIPDDKLKFFSF